MHENNIIHGDVKAANVLLDADVNPVLCDFGMTKILDGEATSTAMKGAGSLRWMAPELMDNAPRSPKTDVYSFGMTIAEVRRYTRSTLRAIFYQVTALKIVTGNVPYPNLHSQFALVKAISIGQRPPFDPASRQGKSFDTLWTLAARCWEADPEQRPSASGLKGMVAGE